MKKGFTLMELIAIVMLLAILSAMTYYEASKTISFAEQKTVEQSAILVLEAVDHYYSELGYVGFPSEGINIKRLDIKSTGFQYGYVKLEHSKYRLVNLFDGEYCVNGFRDDLDIQKRECYAGEEGKYVYYQSITDSNNPIPTNPKQGSTSIPMKYSSYLRLPIESTTTLGTPQACLSNDGRQFCLDYTEVFKEEKIKEFLDYDEDTWYTFRDGTSIYKVKPAEGVEREEILEAIHANVEEEDAYQYLGAVCSFSDGDVECKLYVPGGWNMLVYRKTNNTFSVSSKLPNSQTSSFTCSVAPQLSWCFIQ